MKEGTISKEKTKNNEFIEQFIKVKRDKKCFLVEPEELINDQWMTRSFFAFGDFKESLSNKYMVALIKSLRNTYWSFWYCIYIYLWNFNTSFYL